MNIKIIQVCEAGECPYTQITDKKTEVQIVMAL